MVSHKAAILVTACFALWLALPAPAQEIRVLTYRSSLDETDQPYAIYLPESYSPARRYPLLVSLHGAGGDHRSGLRQVLGNPDKPRELPMIVAAPYGRGSMGYSGIADRGVLDVMRAVENAFPLDPTRYYLTGVSMGGSGSYHLLAQYPGLWAAGFRWQWLSLPYRLLDPLPDWVFFQRDLDHVIAQGHWDSEGQLTTEDRKILTQTGKVELRP